MTGMADPRTRCGWRPGSPPRRPPRPPAGARPTCRATHYGFAARPRPHGPARGSRRSGTTLHVRIQRPPEGVAVTLEDPEEPADPDVAKSTFTFTILDA